jgi:hypothetical protein
MGGAAPGPHGAEGAAARHGLAEGEPCGGRSLGGVADADHHPAEGTLPVPLPATYHHDRAHGAGGHRQADRAQQHAGDLTAPTGTRDQGKGLTSRTQQSRNPAQSIASRLESDPSTPTTSVRSIVTLAHRDMRISPRRRAVRVAMRRIAAIVESYGDGGPEHAPLRPARQTWPWRRTDAPGSSARRRARPRSVRGP